MLPPDRFGPRPSWLERVTATGSSSELPTSCLLPAVIPLEMPKAGETWQFSGNVASIQIFGSASSNEVLQSVSCYWSDGKLRQFTIATSAAPDAMRVHVKSMQGLSWEEAWLPTRDEITGKMTM